MYLTKFRVYENQWIKNNKNKRITQQEWIDIRFLFERLIDSTQITDESDYCNDYLSNDILYTNLTTTSIRDWDQSHKIIKKAIDDNIIKKDHFFSNGLTPIHLCCQSGNYKCLETLICFGGGLNLDLIDRGSTRYSALVVATISGHIRCLQILIQNKCDINLQVYINCIIIIII